MKIVNSLIQMHLGLLYKEIKLFMEVVEPNFEDDLKLFGLSIHELDDYNFTEIMMSIIPNIVGLAKSILIKNEQYSNFNPNWNTNGYYHRKHNINIKKSIDHLDPLLDKMHANIDLIDIISDEDFINADLIKDSLFNDLIKEINIAYKFGLNTAIFQLTRKFVENCIIEILRKYYPQQDELWQYTRNNITRIQNFSTLIENLFTDPNIFSRVNVSAFETTIEQIEVNLDDIRTKTNPVVHSIAFYPSKTKVEELKDIISSLMPILSKMLE